MPAKLQWCTTELVSPKASEDFYREAPTSWKETIMGYTSATAGSRSCRSTRRRLTSSVTFASAGILALGLVTVPPDVDVARNEVHAVRLAAFPLPQAAYLGALEKFIRDRAQTVVSVTKVAVGGAANIPAAVVKTPTAGSTAPVSVDSAIGPRTDPHSLAATSLAATPAALSLPAPIAGVLGVLLLFGPLIVLVILACPPCALFNFLTFTIPSLFIPFAPLAAVAQASTATVEVDATPQEGGPVDPAPATETEKADVSAPVTSDDKRTGIVRGTPMEPAKGTEETATETGEDVTETVGAEQASTEQPAASDAESPIDASDPTKPVARPASPRPVVRDSLGTDKKASDPAHRGKGSANAESSSAASSPEASPSAERKTSGDDTSGGDADGS
jgi:hypothetical protein